MAAKKQIFTKGAPDNDSLEFDLPPELGASQEASGAVEEGAEEFVPKEHNIMDLFEELSFKEKWAKVSEGLKAPKDSGDYKWAQLQMLRLLSPISAVVVPIIFMFLLAIFAAMKPPPAPAVEVTVMEPEEVEELDEIEELLDPPPDPPEIEVTDVSEAISEFEAPGPPSPDTAFSPQPASFDSVAMVKSPVVMRGILGSRSPGARGSALGRFGGGGGTEAAVMRALRWLKKYQEPNGCWLGSSGGGSGGEHNGAASAYTGLALLAYLAHGETPASQEFGPTVEKALKFLVGDQDASGMFNSRDEENYTQPIATYALCEASALCKIPMVREAAEKGIAILIAGQQPAGGWTYGFDTSTDNQETITKTKWEGGKMEDTGATKTRKNKYTGEAKEVGGKKRVGGTKTTSEEPNPKFGKSRNDISFGGWCAQALKAAKMASLEAEGIEEALKKAVGGLTANSSSGGSFSYVTWAGGAGKGVAVGKDNVSGGRLTGVGVLCLQLLGSGNSSAASQGLQWLNAATCSWTNPYGNSPIYYWYYITQAKFHSGGQTWSDWNKQFSPQLVKNQKVIPKAIENAHGNMVDIGYWEPATEKETCQSYVYNTTLCTLMLEVYYRYLPTFQKPKDLDVGGGAEEGVVGAEDIEIDIQGI